MDLAFVKEIYQIWITERPTQLAAALAYYGIFSIAPVIYIAFTIAGIFIDNLALAEQVATRLSEIFGEEVVLAPQNMIASIAVGSEDSTTTWSWLSSVISFLALFWAASGLFNQIYFTLNRLWRVPIVPRSKPGGMVRHRLMSFLMVILLGLLLVLIAVGNILLSWADSIFDLPTDYAAIGYLAFVGLAALTFALIYKFVPDVNLRWRDVWLGAFVAALLEMIGVLVIGVFLQFGIFESPSAAAGTFAVLLVIMYFMAQIFLLGAVITRVFTLKYGSQSATLEYE